MAKIYTITFLMAVFVAAPVLTYAATLEFDTSFVSRTVGSTFTIGVNVSSPEEAINAVSGVVSFPTDWLEVASVSKAYSIIDLWVQEPLFSNTQGTVAFEGVILNPGFQGDGGEVMRITFRTKSEGESILKFVSSAILANDGTGTNILKQTATANISVRMIPPSRESIPESEQIEVDSTSNSVELSDDAAIPETPVITHYRKEIIIGETFTVQGLANPGVDVTTTLLHDGSVVQEQKNRAIATGEFIAVLGPLSEVGEYAFILEAVDEAGNRSEVSAPFVVVVKDSWFNVVTNTALKYLSLSVFIIIVLAGAVIALMFIWYRFLGVVRNMRREGREAKRVSGHTFTELRKRIDKHIARLKKAKRKLTKEEQASLEEFSEELEEAEEAIAKEIKDISNS